MITGTLSGPAAFPHAQNTSIARRAGPGTLRLRAGTLPEHGGIFEFCYFVFDYLDPDRSGDTLRVRPEDGRPSRDVAGMADRNRLHSVAGCKYGGVVLSLSDVGCHVPLGSGARRTRVRVVCRVAEHCWADRRPG